MESVGNMAGLRTEASMIARATKNGRARSDDLMAQSGGGFEALLAQNPQTVPTPMPSPMPSLAPAQTAQGADTGSIETASVDVRHVATSGPQGANETLGDAHETGHQRATGAAQGAPAATATPNATVPVATGPLMGEVNQAFLTNSAAGEPNSAALTQSNAALAQGEAPDAQTILAQLSALSTELSNGTVPGGPNTAPSQAAPTGAQIAQTTKHSVTPNSGPTVGQDTEMEGSAGSIGDTPANENSVTTPQATAINDASVQTAGKSKAGDVASVDPKSVPVTTNTHTALDASASGQTASPTDAGLPTPEPANTQTQFTPQTIPMLAATIMRRLESGARQFIMRLDPPELGQVEVKLTMEADKKVRAVISADRPEALADLVRSARELARALLDAGLDLDEQGLTFTLNDPADSKGQDGRGQRHQRDEAMRSIGSLVDGEASLAARATAQSTSNDPFQRWQRARIALTA